MKLQTIKTQQGYVAVSDEEAEEVHYRLFLHDNSIYQGSMEKGIHPDSRKIIATDDSYKLEGVPQFELEVQDETCFFCKIRDKGHSLQYRDRDWFQEGWDAAQSNSCYTEDEWERLTSDAWLNEPNPNDFSHNSFIYASKAIFKSLKQPKELVAIEVEEDWIPDYSHNKPSFYANSYTKKFLPKLIKSEQYPDGLLQVKQYYYENHRI